MKNFIIYLPEYATSTAMANLALSSGYKFNWNITLFEGVNGIKAEWDLPINTEDSKCQKLMERPGVRGCFLSHWKLWNLCVSINENIGIFEHDVMFINSPPINIVYKDVLKLEGFIKNKPRSAGVWYEGARAYFITPTGAKKIISWVEKNGALPADVVIGSKVVDITLDNNNCVISTNQPTSRKERHTNSFTWNLEEMK